MTHYLIFGGSRGLGALFSRALPQAGDTVWLVSRTPPDLSDRDGVGRRWIQADLSQRGAGAVVAQRLENVPLDVCIYNAGIWESTAFSDEYDFEQISDEESEGIVMVNLLSAMTCIQKALPALRRSPNGKIIVIGSNAGLENSKRPEVAYTATKFGLRGFVHALRENVRKDLIGVTCLNLGDVGGVTFVDGELRVSSGDRVLISPQDIVLLLKAVIAMSNSACVKEIDMVAMTDVV
jgi:short-subunit dehydrogenase